MLQQSSILIKELMILSLLERYSRQKSTAALGLFLILSFVDLLSMRNNSLETLDCLRLITLVEHLWIELNICKWFILSSLQSITLALRGFICVRREFNDMTRFFSWSLNWSSLL
jgi:hypothetical protein